MPQELFEGILVDYSRDKLISESAHKKFKSGYLLPDETSPQQRYARVSTKFSSDEDHAQRLYEYSSRHWFGYATPILNIGISKKSMPISCNLVSIEDTAEGLVESMAEVANLSMSGAGVGINFGMRSSSEKSSGVMPHLKTYDAISNAYKQSSRRGAFAAYLRVDHPDIMMFLDVRKQTGDPAFRVQNLHSAVALTDEFMEIIDACLKDPKHDDSFQLRDPNGTLGEVVRAREIWSKLIENRLLRGEPYMFFYDTTNRSMPMAQKLLGLEIKQSNLCSEITLPTNAERTAVCCLSSLNLAKYDEWKDNEQFIQDVMEMLDNVLTYFITNAPDELQKARYSAMRERSVGLGVMGFHSYLQSHMIPFESALATSFTRTSSKMINERSLAASKRLAVLRGEAPDIQSTVVFKLVEGSGAGHLEFNSSEMINGRRAFEYAAGDTIETDHGHYIIKEVIKPEWAGQRFTSRLAVAPTVSNASLCGNVSPSVEPWIANVFRHDTSAGFMLESSVELMSLLHKKCKENSKLDYDEIMESIANNGGSIQHLTDVFDDWERDVFKTAVEIDMMWVVEHAAIRQEFIDQAQSINLFFRAGTHLTKINNVHMAAWKRGLKTLYYCRTPSSGATIKIDKKVERETYIADDVQCLSCEG